MEADDVTITFRLKRRHSSPGSSGEAVLLRGSAIRYGAYNDRSLYIKNQRYWSRACGRIPGSAFINIAAEFNSHRGSRTIQYARSWGKHRRNRYHGAVLASQIERGKKPTTVFIFNLWQNYMRGGHAR